MIDIADAESAEADVDTDADADVDNAEDADAVDVYADIDDDIVTPSSSTKSYTHRSVPSSLGRSFLMRIACYCVLYVSQLQPIDRLDHLEYHLKYTLIYCTVYSAL